MLDPKLGGVVEFRLSESGIRLQGACQLKFPTWNSEIPTSQYKLNAASVSVYFFVYFKIKRGQETQGETISK